MKNKIFIIAVVAVLLVIALCLSFVPSAARYIDVSGGKFDVSDESKAYLATLDESVTVHVLNADKKNAKMDAYLEKYASFSDNITIEYVKERDVAALVSAKGYEGYSETSFSPYSLLVTSDKRSEVLEFYTLFCYSNEKLGFEEISYSEYSYYMSAFSQNEDYLEYLNSLMFESKLYFYGDRLITRAVEYVALDMIPRVYLVNGHGEDDVKTGNIAQVLTTIGYGYGSFDITSGQIPEDASVIIINAPAEDYTESEADAVIEYLKGGGRLIFIGGKANADMPNIGRIAEYYGISVSDSLISVESGSDDGEASEEELHKFSPTLNFDHDIFADFYTNTAPVIINANAIGVLDGLRPSQIVTPVLTTSSEGYLDDPSAKSVLNAGVCVEEETERGNTRIVWLTGAESYNGTSAGTGNFRMIASAIDWTNLHYESAMTAEDPILFEDPYLAVESGKLLSIAAVTIAIIPAAFVLSGVLILLKRKRA
ncbi:MAG: hypothetical protein E7641_01930 [Ruminococcaceae bacterium]|nr:hypothetical protein [Oscillospiraceae bacterium]